jgi:ketosteroid isomerase-like protein
MTGRSDDINDLKTGNFKVDAIDFDDLKVHVYGDAAVVTGKVTLKNCKYRSQDVSGQYRFTDTWARTNGGWQLLASHATMLPKR